MLTNALVLGKVKPGLDSVGLMLASEGVVEVRS